jgi:MFS family permease
MIESQASSHNQAERMSGLVFFWALTSALAGFLFGFDTVVISGAEQKIQSLWGISDSVHGIPIASALYGTFIGALIGGWLTERFGRRPTLLWLGVLYLISSLGSALAPNVYVFFIARVIGGLGIGISTVVAPLYISEIAPPKYRGRLAGLFQFNIVFGIVVAYASNRLLDVIGESAWRWMLGVAAIPSLIYTIFVWQFLKARAGCWLVNGTVRPASPFSDKFNPTFQKPTSMLWQTKFRPTTVKFDPEEHFGVPDLRNRSCSLS